MSTTDRLVKTCNPAYEGLLVDQSPQDCSLPCFALQCWRTRPLEEHDLASLAMSQLVACHINMISLLPLLYFCVARDKYQGYRPRATFSTLMEVHSNSQIVVVSDVARCGASSRSQLLFDILGLNLSKDSHILPAQPLFLFFTCCERELQDHLLLAQLFLALLDAFPSSRTDVI